MTMNFRLKELVPTFTLLLAMGCGARSPLDTLGDQSVSSEGGILGGNFGGGGHAGTFGAGGALAKGGAVSAGGYYYNSGGYAYGGYYYDTTTSGGYYYNSGGYRYSSGGYYYSSGGYYYSSGGYYYSSGAGGSTAVGGRSGTGGSNSGGSGGRGGTMSAGGIVNFGGSMGGSAGSVRVDGGFGGGGGSVKVDAYVSQDLLPDVVLGRPETGGTFKLDGSVTTDGNICQGLASNEELIDDLNDGDRFIPLVNGRVGAWTDYHDASPSGKMFPDPSTGFVPTDTGDVCRKFAAYVAGTGYVLTGAGFWFGLGSPYDASKYTGISFWAKIDAGTSPGIRVAFPDKDTQPDGNICPPGTCYNHYGYLINPLTTTWTKYTVSFSKLTQGQGWGHLGTAFDPATIYQVAFEIPVNATFGIWIDDVAFTM
jgi:hypothetical protein